MWFFKRKKKVPKEMTARPRCPWCEGDNTRPAFYNGDEDENVKVWRGQRSVAFRCWDCGRDFYADELPSGVGEPQDDLPVVEDEEVLRAAEEELRREIDEGGDRRFPG